MKELVLFIARSLVDDPTQVILKESHSRSGVHLRLSVAKEDMGRVIGKQGKIANAIRTLLNVAAAQTDTQVTLDIDDPR